MKIKIDAVEMPQSPLHEAGKTYCYPLVMTQQTKTTEDMVNHIQEVCTLTKVDCNAVIEALSEYIASTLIAGNVLHIDHLGTFSTALRFRDSQKAAPLQSAGDVQVMSVNFRPERDLMVRLRGSMQFERKEAVRSSNLQLAPIVLQLQTYFETHNTLTTRQFESLFGLKRTRASNLLNTLVEQQKLVRETIGTAFLYHAGPTLMPPTPKN